MDSLTRGAVVFPLWEGGGIEAMSNLRHHRGTLTGGTGTPTWEIGGVGPYLKFTRANSHRVQIARPLIHTSKTWSVGAVFRNDATGNALETIYGEADKATDTAVIYLSANYLTLGSVGLLCDDNGNTPALLNVAGAATNDGEWHVVVGRERGDSLRDLWLDGVSIGVNTDAQGSRSNLNTSSIGCQNKAAPADHLSGAVALVVVWPRRSLGDAEIMRWSANPFAILAPEPRPRYRAPVVAGAAVPDTWYYRMTAQGAHFQ